MKALLWLAVALVGVFALVYVVGALFQSDTGSGQTRLLTPAQRQRNREHLIEIRSDHVKDSLDHTRDRVQEHRDRIRDSIE